MVNYEEFASGTCVEESLHLPLKVFVDSANYGLKKVCFLSYKPASMHSQEFLESGGS